MVPGETPKMKKSKHQGYGILAILICVPVELNSYCNSTHLNSIQLMATTFVSPNKRGITPFSELLKTR